MLTHEQIWHAIDRLATSFGYSPSGLAKQSGLDATSFNKSKRHGPDGKPRWPSTESISRILAATGATMSDFVSLVDDLNEPVQSNELTIPLINFTQAGENGYFDKEGCPQGHHWNETPYPELNKKNDNGIYALEINDNSMKPIYRKGDILIISPKSKRRAGDRIIVKTKNSDIMIKELIKQTATQIEICTFKSDHENTKIQTQDIAWMGRIIWVSQ